MRWASVENREFNSIGLPLVDTHVRNAEISSILQFERPSADIQLGFLGFGGQPCGGRLSEGAFSYGACIFGLLFGRSSEVMRIRRTFLNFCQCTGSSCSRALRGFGRLVVGVPNFDREYSVDNEREKSEGFQADRKLVYPVSLYIAGNVLFYATWLCFGFSRKWWHYIVSFLGMVLGFVLAVYGGLFVADRIF